LRHPNNGVILRLVAMGVVFTNHITHDTRRLFVRPIPVVVEFVHGKEHAAVNRLESIARIRQSPADDHAHGVIEVAPAHLLFKTDGQGFFGKLCHGRSYLAVSKATPYSKAATHVTSKQRKARIFSGFSAETQTQELELQMTNRLWHNGFNVLDDWHLECVKKIFAALLRLFPPKENHENTK
jgi:hypothetical protein